MTTCLHCSAKIPAGRTYCHPHYVEALRQHKQQVATHRKAIASWDRLCPQAQTIRNQQAEDDELCLMASLVATVAGGYLWYQVNALFPIDGLYGLAIMLVTGIVLLSWTPARQLTGKLARAAFVALPPLIYSLLGLGLFCLLSDMIRANALPLLFGMIGLVLAVSLANEWTGQHKASAMPAYPLEPRP